MTEDLENEGAAQGDPLIPDHWKEDCSTLEELQEARAAAEKAPQLTREKRIAISRELARSGLRPDLAKIQRPLPRTHDPQGRREAIVDGRLRIVEESEPGTHAWSSRDEFWPGLGLTPDSEKLSWLDVALRLPDDELLSWFARGPADTTFYGIEFDPTRVYPRPKIRPRRPWTEQERLEVEGVVRKHMRRMKKFDVLEERLERLCMGREIFHTAQDVWTQEVRKREAHRLEVEAKVAAKQRTPEETMELVRETLGEPLRPAARKIGMPPTTLWRLREALRTTL
jgi:hypothetical protein